MRALALFTTALMLVSAFPSWAKSSPVELSKCETKLDGQSERFNGIVDDLRALGLRNLLAPYDSGKIKVSYRPKFLPWQSNISWHFSWLFSDKLIVRKLKWTTEKERQTAVWRTAVAFYNLQAPRRLWDYKALQPKQAYNLELTADGALDALEYFLYKYPAEWRDVESARREALNAELKTVLESLPLVTEPLPKVSRTRFLGFWNDHLKRIAIVGAICSLPSITELPSCINAIEANATKYFEIATNPEKRTTVSQRFRENLDIELREEIADLKSKLPDARAQGDLNDIYARHPHLASAH